MPLLHAPGTCPCHMPLAHAPSTCPWHIPLAHAPGTYPRHMPRHMPLASAPLAEMLYVNILMPTEGSMEWMHARSGGGVHGWGSMKQSMDGITVGLCRGSMEGFYGVGPWRGSMDVEFILMSLSPRFLATLPTSTSLTVSS